MTPSECIFALIDDSEEDLGRYGDVLERPGVSRVSRFYPPPDLSIDSILRERPDLIVIDYELVRQDGNRSPATYQGGTLATRFRELSPETPIVILTRRNLMRQYKGAVDQMGAVDDVMFKEDLTLETDEWLEFLVDLSVGYRKLARKRKRTFSSLLKVLVAKKGETPLLLEAGIPLKEIADVPSDLEPGEWSVPEVARWIRHVFFKYAGPLYDSLYAAASLGLRESSFLRDEVQEEFQEAIYGGVFQKTNRRWWRNRLFEHAYTLLDEGGLGPPLSHNFAKAFRAKYGISLSPGKCVTSEKSHADSVCYILEKPVRREYSLEYFPDDRPKIMEPARVSFKAIREDNRVRDELFSPSGQALLKQIRQGDNS